MARFNDAWAAKIPLKIKILSWQLILERLPSSEEVAIKHGPCNGLCALCGQAKIASHIFSCLCYGKVCMQCAMVWLVPTNQLPLGDLDSLWHNVWLSGILRTNLPLNSVIFKSLSSYSYGLPTLSRRTEQE